MMIISVNDNSKRYGNFEVDESKETPRSLYERAGADYKRCTHSLNGKILRMEKQLDMTFSELGAKEDASGFCILNAIKIGIAIDGPTTNAEFIAYYDGCYDNDNWDD